jgi:hypothetical protein
MGLKVCSIGKGFVISVWSSLFSYDKDAVHEVHFTCLQIM